MALIDHFLVNSRAASEGGNGYNRISSHNFPGGLFLWAEGDATKASVIAAFGLTEEPTPDADETQLNQLQANYVAKATIAEKALYLQKIHHTLMLSATGVLNKTQAMTILGLT